MYCSKSFVQKSFVTEEADEGEWTIAQATEMFQASNEGLHWRAAFKEGVNLDKTFLEGSDCENTPEEYLDYVARYDLGFLTPCGHQIRFKVRLIFTDIHQAQFLERFLIECRKPKPK